MNAKYTENFDTIRKFLIAECFQGPLQKTRAWHVQSTYLIFVTSQHSGRP